MSGESRSAQEAPLAADAPAETAKTRDAWDKWEAFAKIIGGIGIPIVAAIATGLIALQSEENRKAQFELNLTQARESADTEIRAKMFEFLLARVVAREGKEADTEPDKVVDDLEAKRTMLRLLVDNFPEHIAPRSLFSRLHEKTQRARKNAQGEDLERLVKLEQELLVVARNAREHELASLPIVLRYDDIFVPLRRVVDPSAKADETVPQSDSGRIRLYLVDEPGNLTNAASASVWWRPVVPFEDDKSENYSIIIGVNAIRPDAAEIQLAVSRDTFALGRYKESQEEFRFEFDASVYSTPRFDNTLLPDGTRVSVLYKACIDSDNVTNLECSFPLPKDHNVQAHFEVVVFRGDYQSTRDRPSSQVLLKASTR